MSNNQSIPTLENEELLLLELMNKKILVIKEFMLFNEIKEYNTLDYELHKRFDEFVSICENYIHDKFPCAGKVVYYNGIAYNDFSTRMNFLLNCIWVSKKIEIEDLIIKYLKSSSINISK